MPSSKTATILLVPQHRSRKRNTLPTDIVFLVFSRIFILLSRESAITSSLRSSAICLPPEDGGVPLSTFLNGTTSRLPACSPHCPFNAERQAGKL